MALSKLGKGWVFAILIMAVTDANLIAQNIHHQVKDEETLYSIAQQYRVTVKQLKEWNNLSSNNLSIGQRLVIKKQTAGSSVIHTVKDEETLFSISQRYRVAISDIRNWNDMQNSTLRLGAKLVIYPQSKNSSDNTSPTKVTSAADSDGHYTVKSGDTLFRIAQMHHITVARLKQLNDLASNNIRVGQELNMEGAVTAGKMSGNEGGNAAAPGAFIRYELKQGMPITDLLAMFQMSKPEFEKLNPDLNATYFEKGELVNVLVPATKNEIQSYKSDEGMHIIGTVEASKYSASLMGTTTTNGELYNPMALTAAHSNIAIGSLLFVKNANNQRAVLVRINDRTSENGLQLSKAAWNALGLSGNAARVTIYRIDE